MSFKLILVVFFLLSISYSSTNAVKIITKTEWGGRPAKAIDTIPGKLSYVVIHHSYIPAACETTEDCKKAMRIMQNYHQDEQGWNDIGYSFAIGGDGNIYEGRGFNVVGAHAPGYNSNSVGICLIGDWRNSVAPKIMLDKTKELIKYGIQTGHIDPNYTLYGHRQVKKTTECPGDALFKEIQSWPHFSSNT